METSPKGVLVHRASATAADAGPLTVTDVFISYAREDQVFVRRLHEALTRRRPPKKVWVDLNDIPPAAAWRREVLEAIDSAENFVFVISPDSLASAVCREELARAL